LRAFWSLNNKKLQRVFILPDLTTTAGKNNKQLSHHKMNSTNIHKRFQHKMVSKKQALRKVAKENWTGNVNHSGKPFEIFDFY
jgi:hypothetical protein